MKVCSRCKVQKESIEFHRSRSSIDGLFHYCKKCKSEYKKQQYATTENRAKELARKKEKYGDPDVRVKKLEYEKRRYMDPKIKAAKLRKKQEYYSNLGVQEARRAYSRDYRSQPINKIKKYARHKERYHTDITYKIACKLRSRLRKAIFSTYMAGYAVNYLGCSIEEFKVYLESKFQPGMDWSNYGLYGWHIDHIISLSSFDLTDKEQLLRACHYSNLQPLWAKDNLKKSSKIEH